MKGVYPFVHTLDDMGVFTRSAGDLAAVDTVLRGYVSSQREPLRAPALLGGWFQNNLAPEMRAALSDLSAALGDLSVVELAQVDRARSGAFLITAFEGGALHRGSLTRDPLSYDPATRDRLIAGAAIPEAIYRQALRYKDIFGEAVEAALAVHDVLIAPATFGPAPLIDDPVIMIDGKPQAARANLGLFTQPISYLGLPVVAAPLAVKGLPLGVQLIAAKGRDADLLQFAENLEARGLIAAAFTSRETC
jgi:aspartyl-tRNA(Asn)/glutamyl-tRNA(Gln) amidotransferase subunit A